MDLFIDFVWPIRSDTANCSLVLKNIGKVNFREEDEDHCNVNDGYRSSRGPRNSGANCAGNMRIENTTT